jgi:hypothetical protein
VILWKHNFLSVYMLAMRNVWFCCTVVFLACVGLVVQSNESVVLAYLYVLASSNFGIKLILGLNC